MGDVFQADFEQLAQIASMFANQAEAIEQMNGDIQNNYSPLEQNDWRGEGANAFFGQMTSQLFPAIQRLTDVLHTAQSLTLQVSDLVRNAEEEASRVFGGEGEGTGRVAGAEEAASPSNLPPPRIYIVNGINATEADGTPNASTLAFEQRLESLGYDPSQVTATPAIYNTNYGTHLEGTNLQGTNLQGTSFGGLLSPVDWLTGAGAGAVNGITGAGAGAVNGISGMGASAINGATSFFNTGVGVKEVLDEYRQGSNGQYTQETYAFIQQDLQRNPLLAGQSVMLIGHSGGGAVISNLTPMLEQSGVDVSGVVSMGSPVVNADQIHPYAKYVNITDRFDFGQPLVRSEEGRGFSIPRLATDYFYRDPGINYRWTNSGQKSPLGAHGSYWGSNEVINILRNDFPNLPLNQP